MQNNTPAAIEELTAST